MVVQLHSDYSGPILIELQHLHVFCSQSTVGIWFPYVHVNTLNSKGYLIKRLVRVHEMHLKNELHFK